MTRAVIVARVWEAVYAVSLIAIGIAGTMAWLNYHPEQRPSVTVKTTEWRLVGDVNKDGAVDQSDIQIIRDHWEQSGLGWTGGDLNGDGITNLLDLSICSSNQGNGNNKARLI